MGLSDYRVKNSINEIYEVNTGKDRKIEFSIRH